MRAWDRRALEGMPLKLLIMSLLIALSAPAVLGSMETFERSTARTMLEVEASRLADAVEDVVSAGEGNRRAVVVSLPEAASKHGLHLEIGGDVNATASMAIRCCCGGTPYSIVFLSDPPARLTGPDGRMLRLEGGEHRLMVECTKVGGRMAAVITVMG